MTWDLRAYSPESTSTLADEKIGKMGGSDLSIPRYVVFVLVLALPNIQKPRTVRLAMTSPSPSGLKMNEILDLNVELEFG